MKQFTANHPFFVGLLIVVTAGFLFMIKGFLIPIATSAVVTGLLYPLYEKLKNRLNGKQNLSAAIMLVLFLFGVLIPLSGVVVLIVEQALNVGRTATPWVHSTLNSENYLDDLLHAFPILEGIFPSNESIVTAVSVTANKVGNFFVQELPTASASIFGTVLKVFVFLFCMFSFFVKGPTYLKTILTILPITADDEHIILKRFTAVASATLKGSFIIGIIQAIIGVSVLTLMGFPNTMFWGMIILILSFIPAVGPSVVMIPAAIILIAKGQPGFGTLTFVIGLLMGNIDNLLRPKLVGEESKMPGIIVLISTLGGIKIFGISGLILGPILAVLFLTLWEIFSGISFSTKD